jgi:hypothetical protein
VAREAMRALKVFRRRAPWLLGWAMALIAGGASSALLISHEEDKADPLPAWMSITTAAMTAEAKECYRHEAKWQASTFCASPVADLVEVVWASCFGEERSLLLAAIEDSGSDDTGMQFLSDLETESRGDVVSMIREAKSISQRCSNSVGPPSVAGVRAGQETRSLTP